MPSFFYRLHYIQGSWPNRIPNAQPIQFGRSTHVLLSPISLTLTPANASTCFPQLTPNTMNLDSQLIPAVIHSSTANLSLAVTLASSHAPLSYHLAVTHLSLPPLKTLTPLLNTLPPPFVNGYISKYQKNPFNIYNRYNTLPIKTPCPQGVGRNSVNGGNSPKKPPHDSGRSNGPKSPPRHGF
jgi:hypothetical protein